MRLTDPPHLPTSWKVITLGGRVLMSFQARFPSAVSVLNDLRIPSLDSTTVSSSSKYYPTHDERGFNVTKEWISIPRPEHDEPLRLFVVRPSKISTLRPPRVMVYFHGGGYVLGAPETPILEFFVREQFEQDESRDLFIVSAHYRLAPQSTHADMIEDALQSLDYAKELYGDDFELIVSGESAGGHLALTLAHVLRDGGYEKHPKDKIFVAPIYALYAKNAEAFGEDRPLLASHDEFGEHGYILRKSMMDHFMDAIPDMYDLLKNPSDLPPMYLISAEYDMLRDEGKVYADRLRHAEVPPSSVRWEVAKGQVHGFCTPALAVGGGVETVKEWTGKVLRAAENRFVSP